MSLPRDRCGRTMTVELCPRMVRSDAETTRSHLQENGHETFYPSWIFLGLACCTSLYEIGLPIHKIGKGITIKAKVFFPRLLRLLIALLPQLVLGQADSSSRSLRLNGLEATAEFGGSVVYQAKVEFGLASHRVAIGYRYNREIPPLLIFSSENHPKRTVKEINVHYVIGISWSGKVFQLSAGPGIVFGDRRGSLISSESKGNHPTYFGARINHYYSQRLNSLSLSGDAQVLSSLFWLVDYGFSLHGNLNRQDSFWGVTALLKVHILGGARSAE